MCDSCLIDFRALDRGFHCLLKVFLRDVVASRIAGARVGGNFRSWENVLPCPGTIRVAIFPFQRERQIDATAAVAEIMLMNFLHALKMKPE